MNERNVRKEKSLSRAAAIIKPNRVEEHLGRMFYAVALMI